MEDKTILQRVVSLENFIFNEQRALDYLLANMDQCEEGEIEETEKRINEKTEELEQLKILLD